MSYDVYTISTIYPGNLFTSGIYWLLCLIWAAVFLFFIIQFRIIRTAHPALSILVGVLAIDLCRTLFESLYFGLFFELYLGVLAPRVHEVLGNPIFLAAPKILNVFSGLLVLFILAFRFIPTVKLESEKIAAQKIQERELDYYKDIEEERNKLIATQLLFKMGSWETNPDTLDMIWSPETYSIFGLSPETFSPTNEAFLSLIHPEDRSAVDTAFRQSLNSMSATSIEHRILMQHNSIKYIVERWQTYPGRDGRPAKVLGTCQDITELKTNEFLIYQAERMKSIGQLTGGIAHDFNNLLTVVLGNG